MRGVDRTAPASSSPPPSRPAPAASSSASAARPRPTAGWARCGRCSPMGRLARRRAGRRLRRPHPLRRRGRGLRARRRARPTAQVELLAPPARAPGPGLRGGLRRRRPRPRGRRRGRRAGRRAGRRRRRRSSPASTSWPTSSTSTTGIEGADLVVTGEGFLDEQSFEGKVVGGVLELAAPSRRARARRRRRGARRPCRRAGAGRQPGRALRRASGRWPTPRACVERGRRTAAFS